MINSIQNYYMYEILEDYHTAETLQEQNEIFSSFCSIIWNCPNNRKITKKNITFCIKPELLSTKIGKVFMPYTSISYLVCPSITQNTDFAYLIRQKVNNIYTNLFDTKICMHKDYLNLLHIPKQLYFQWEASLLLKNNWSLTPEELTYTLEHAMKQAATLKETLSKQKMKLDWKQYQKIVEKFFQKLFHNYISLDEYQDNSVLVLETGTWHEDNFCISYFCNGLNGYFKNYQKKYYGLYNANSNRNRDTLYARCLCGNLFLQNKQRNRKLCDNCRKQAKLEKYKRYNQKRKEHIY